MHGHLLPLIAEIDFSTSIGLGSLLVGGIVAAVYVGIRYRIDKKAVAEQVWQSEHAAQKERADRLQREKDEQQQTINELGAHVQDLEVQVAELRGRPDLKMVKDMLDTISHATSEMARALMEQLQLHDRHAMEGLGRLSDDITKLVDELRIRAAKFRRSDEAGDPPGLE